MTVRGDVDKDIKPAQANLDRMAGIIVRRLTAMHGAFHGAVRGAALPLKRLWVGKRSPVPEISFRRRAEGCKRCLYILAFTTCTIWHAQLLKHLCAAGDA